MSEDKSSAIADQLQALRDMFRQRLDSEIPQLERLADALASDSDTAPRLEEMLRALHKMAGSAGTFGFPELGSAARSLEVRLQGWVQNSRPTMPPAQDLHDLRRDVHALRGYLTEHQPVDEPSDDAAQTTDRPSKINGEVVVCLVEDEEPLAQELKRIFGHFGYVIHRYTLLAEAAQSLHHRKPDVIILDVAFESNGLNTIEQVVLSPEFTDLGRPIIFLSDRDTFDIRVQAARIGAEGFFPKPVDVPKLIDRVEQSIRRKQDIPYRLLIVDDDEELAKHYALVLKADGMEAKTLSEPQGILHVLREFQPELILMDVAMPGYTGMDLARVIRMHEEWVSMPIIYLSAETDKDRQLSALSSGGDDFLTKPISDHHLAAAISVRAARMRQLTELMVKDSLTGLLKHSRIKEQIALEFARTKRERTSLCVAMLDIDHFKKVNDTYGHVVGDQVIKALAHLLKQRLRKTDGIGRYGGEEFAVVLPRCEPEAARELLDDIRKRFKEIRFTAENEDFTVTLSAGAVMAEEYPDASAMLVAADEALYDAKRSGRDRIHLGGAMQKDA
ncbi:diguanylate cyclase [Desulfonatronum lacustre]|uniref:diguanylate cyclase n=1 Tax=Desulfonatronum lacustre TaxID=66849 RepID=UPI00048BB05C|nr:diguanylate cyclase [Desulfonatronum lacustre]